MLKQRELGKTGILVSPLGLGTVKFGRNTGVKYPESFEIPTDSEIRNLLALAKENGINLIDTAPAYGTSEKRLAKLLAGQRHEWVICGKVGEEYINEKSIYDFSSKYIEFSVKKSLKRLNTDYLDILLLHSDGNDLEILEQDALTTLLKLKHQGLVRAVGMSSKTVAGGIKSLELADVVMLTYNPTDGSEKVVVDYAHTHQKGVLVKKGLVSGHLDKMDKEDPIQYCMNFIFKEPGISSLVVGTIQQKHLKHNIDCVTQALKSAM